MDTNPVIAQPHRVIARAAGTVGLLGVALVHLLDLQSKLHETPYLGLGYIALIVGAVGTAGALIHRDSRSAWVAAALLAGLTLAGYVVNRTVGMPSATDDIGNWLEPLGLASLFVEGITVAVSAYALADERGGGIARLSRRRLQAA